MASSEDGPSHNVPSPDVRSVSVDDVEEFHDARPAPPYCEECYEDDVDRLSVFTLEGVNWNGMYCDRHDPRDRPGADMWELVDDE